MRTFIVSVASLCLTFLLSTSFANNTHSNNMKYVFNNAKEIASQVMQVSALKIKPTKMVNSSTEVFLDLKNTGRKAHQLIAATSPIAKQVRLHKTTEHTKYVEDMTAIKTIKIKPHQEKVLKEGGIHIMLIGLNKQVVKGDTVPLTLVFSDGSSITVQSPVI